MLLSSLDDTSDSRLFGAVHDGAILDDGGPVESEVLAMALELWRITGDLAGVRAGLEQWRPGEPWELWLEAALAEWADLRPRVLRGYAMIDALALVGEATRADVAAARAMERALTRHNAARAAGVRTAILMREVLRG